MARPRSSHLCAGFTILLSVGCLAVVTACSDPQDGSVVTSSPRFQGSDDPSAPGEGAAQPASSRRKLIKTVTLQLRVEDTGVAAAEIEARVQGLGGFVSHLSSESPHYASDSISGEYRWFRLTLRVPSEQLGGLVRTLREMAVVVDSEQLQTEDATARYVDLGARVKNLSATEDELRTLLAEARERRQDVEDIMKVYERLTEIRGQIERIEAQRASIDELSALSTVELTLLPEPLPAARIVSWQPLQTVRDAWDSLLAILRVLATVGIYLVLVVLPVGLLLGVPIWWLVRRWRQGRSS